METKHKSVECYAKIVVLPSNHLKAEITSNQTVSKLDKIRAVCAAFVKFVNSNGYTVTCHPAGNRTRVYHLTKEEVLEDMNKVEDFRRIASILVDPQSLNDSIVVD